MLPHYGNYCGPYWSDGKVQSSVVGTSPAIDDFDQTCKAHDANYAQGNYEKADYDFYKENVGTTSILRNISGLVVGAQGVLRTIGVLDSGADDKKTNLIMTKKNTKVKLNPLRVSRAKNRSAATPTTGPNPPVPLRAAPVAITAGVSMTKPTISSRNGKTIVSNREYVGYIAGSTSFAVTTYPSNPGVPLLFSWLNNVANNYDRYCWKRLQFLYIPAVSSATAGRIAFSYNYNAADAAPTTKLGVLSIKPSLEESVWAPFSLNVPVDNKIYFTRDTLVEGTDIKTYDMGELYVTTDLCSGTSTIGELYVEYEIELEKPHANIPPTAELYANSGVTLANMLPTSTTTATGADFLSNTTTANTIRIGATGRYLFMASVVGTVTPAWNNLTGIIGTVATVSGFTNTGQNSATNGLAVQCYDVTVDSKLQYATILIGSTGTTVTETYLIVTRIDSGMAVAFQNA